MLNRYVVYFFIFMLMEIIAFTLATMTQDSIFCDEGDSEMFKKARTSIFGKVINNIFRFTNCNVYFPIIVKSKRIVLL